MATNSRSIPGSKLPLTLPNQLDRLPQELLCQVIEGIGTPIHYDDLLNLIEAYPAMEDRINGCVTEIDFTDGISIVDKIGRRVNDLSKLSDLLFTDRDLEEIGIPEIYPQLKQYRIAVDLQPVKRKLVSGKGNRARSNVQSSPGKSIESYQYDLSLLTKFLMDPKARWLYIIINEPLEDFEQYPELFKALAIGISKRVKRYGPDFTIVFQASSSFGLNFSYHNRTLHFEKTDYPFVEHAELGDEEDEEGDVSLDLEHQLQLFKLFEDIIDVVGADDSRFLNKLFVDYTKLIPTGLTKVYLNSPFTKRHSDYIKEEDGSEFFKYLTEIRHEPLINKQMKDAERHFLSELEEMDVQYPKLTVMELPIPIAKELFYRHYFPNVKEFVFLETLMIRYHQQAISQLEATITKGQQRRLTNQDVTLVRP